MTIETGICLPFRLNNITSPFHPPSRTAAGMTSLAMNDCASPAKMVSRVRAEISSSGEIPSIRRPAPLM